MSKQCKVRSKKNLALPLFAIIFIITIQVNAKQRWHKIPFQSYSAIVDSPPPVKRPEIIDTAAKKNPVAVIDSTNAFTDTTLNDSLAQLTDTLNVKLSKDSLTARSLMLLTTAECLLYQQKNLFYTEKRTRNILM